MNRINDWIKHISPDWYSFIHEVPYSYKIIESDASGKAILEIQSNHKLISLEKLDCNPIKWIINTKTPDKVILEIIPEKGVNLYVFELKRSVDNSELCKARRQLIYGVLCGLCAIGLLRYSLQNIYVCLAYCTDCDMEKAYDPALCENPGIELSYCDPWVFWNREKIDLELHGISELFELKKVRLDKEADVPFAKFLLE